MQYNTNYFHVGCVARSLASYELLYKVRACERNTYVGTVLQAVQQSCNSSCRLKSVGDFRLSKHSSITPEVITLFGDFRVRVSWA